MLRELLAESCGGAASEWTVSCVPDGPPCVLSAAVCGPWPSVAIAHSGDWVAVACGPQPIGLDIEAHRARDRLEGLSALVLTPAERRGLTQRIERDGLERVFYIAWTLKEARVKQRGGAVSPAVLQRLRVSPSEPGSANAHVWQSAALTLSVMLGETAALRAAGEGMPTEPAQLWRVDESLAPPAVAFPP
ncbi:4'-phosphopantetheinyl transferase superfamily protein [Schlegelella sp. S2-27]|uniref:4'-phosphopantetheinyl transferase superfamily protein n=1 Tax=Caldimonas mangrovi TaxID=2944811 RepID=A0ABT0YWW9_9BURK|nr:4'-phosphopantetheinyl transferase superfamily protein [Caldimonas mangrovi]MCM5682681.1 4'-phosphopantetheinyl transferase superfamily protein [Caldimonas mangrovi]